MDDFKCASVDSLLSLLSREEIEPKIFLTILCEKVKKDGLTNNQYNFLLDVVDAVIFKYYGVKKDK